MVHHRKSSEDHGIAQGAMTVATPARTITAVRERV